MSRDQPDVWQRVLVTTTFTLRDLDKGISVGMAWHGIHLYQFRFRATRYESWKL